VVVTPSQTYDFAHEDHEFISDIFSRISAYEKKKILRRMLRGKHEKTKQGRYVGGRRPYGYRIVEGQFVIEEEEAEIVREIFRRCAAGESCEAIGRALTQAGIPTPLGRSSAWPLSSIKRILRDSKYAGAYIRWQWRREERGLTERSATGRLVRRPDTEWITVACPAIIPPELLAAAQQALASRRQLAKRNAKRAYLLSGLIRCGTCQSRMVGECYPRERRYYVCWQKRRPNPDRPPCPLPALPAEPLEAAVWEAVATLLSQPAVLEQAVTLAQSSAGSSAHESARIQRLIKARQEERERLLRLYMTGALGDQETQRHLNRIQTELDALTAQQTAARAVERHLHRFLDAQHLLDHAATRLRELTFEERRRLLTLLLAPEATPQAAHFGIWCYPEGQVELVGLLESKQELRLGIGAQSCLRWGYNPKPEQRDLAGGTPSLTFRYRISPQLSKSCRTAPSCPGIPR
jgi:site-specific DNA recombinase